MRLPNGERAMVDIRKLQEYCLNSQHPRGRNKARVFASVGIRETDAEELRMALLAAASKADAELGSLRATIRAQAVAAYGYDAARIGEGVAALSEAQTLVSQQAKEYGEAHQATEDLNKAFDKASEAYRKALKVARVVFLDPAAIGALKLAGPRKESTNGFLEQATPFYDNLVASPTLLATISQYGFSEARVKAEQKLVADVRQAVNAQLRETGEAQLATRNCDKSIDALDTWVSGYRAICKVALADEPQQLEQLGIVVLNQARNKAKVTA